MSHVEKLVQFSAKTAGREKLIRLCQYTTKFVHSTLHLYYTKYATGGRNLVEYIYKLRELEQYFISCRRFLLIGRCIDEMYFAFKSIELNDPVLRLTSSISKFWLSLQLFADHTLWMHQMGLIKTIDKQIWIDRAHRFWLYAVIMNLSRDFYEIICSIQHRRYKKPVDQIDNSGKFESRTVIEWMKANPKLSCDLVKNSCDFWIPYLTIKKIPTHSSVLGLLGMISTVIGVLQIYDKNFSLNSS